jgi:hypothetical protein
VNDLLDVQTFIGRLAEGRTADTRFADPMAMMVMLFHHDTVDYAYQEAIDRDPLARGLTGDFAIDLWRAVRDGHMELAHDRPLAALRRMQETSTLHPAGERPGGLPQIERAWLIARCLAEHNEIRGAINFCQTAMVELAYFVDRIEQAPAEAASQVKTMFEVITSQRGIITQLYETLPEEAFLDSWLMNRGVDLFGSLTRTVSDLFRAAQEYERAQTVTTRQEVLLLRYHDVVGAAFDRAAQAVIAQEFGGAWTELDDRRAYNYFETVVTLRGIESGILAAVNAANALTRLGDHAEAEARYRTCKSVLAMRGDHFNAACVWNFENLANWNRRGNPDIYHSVVEAIRYFEANLPSVTGKYGLDPHTFYARKKYIEDSGYLLLIAVIASMEDRSEVQLNELLGALCALSSREQLAKLRPDEVEAGWQAVLDKQKRPIAIMQNALQPLSGTSVLHLVASIGFLVWVAYGYDDDGRFHFEICIGDLTQRDLIVDFIETLRAQQVADVVDDAIRVAELNAHLEELGDRIGAALSPSFMEFLNKVKHVQFMPHPRGNLDEFPLSGVRFGGKWLADTHTITRSPTVNQLWNLLSPNRPLTFGHPRGAVVLGDPETGGPLLRRAREHGAWVENAWKSVYQFEPQVAVSANPQLMHDWLEGDVGALHYVGHGYSNMVSEGLPLSGEEAFDIYDLDRLSGTKTPFIFICACEVSRTRHGLGGYQAGVASGLANRGAVAVLAFSLPIPESRAYTVAQRFYQEALTVPLGEAVQNTQQAMAEQVPTYAWLALTAYGDPAFRLAETVNEGERVTDTAGLALTWHSALRNHAVLRTNDSEHVAREKLAECPETFRPLANTILEGAFRETPVLSPSQLDQLEAELLLLAQSAPVEALTLRCLICLERAHQVGLDEWPSRAPDSRDASTRMLNEMEFILDTSIALIDWRMYGLGRALGGLLITINNAIDYARPQLEMAVDTLLECIELSPFVERIRTQAIEILKMFPR